MNGTEETGGQRFILIENLEIDLSPLSIMEFIHKHTSISPLAYVFPSLSSESFARGAIVLDCKKKHKNVYQFLDNHDHVITSTKGRPWVVSENSLRHGTFRTTFGSLMPKSQYKIQKKIIDDELKIIHSGAEEHSTAERLRDLYKDFADHQIRLHMRFALDERKILAESKILKSSRNCKIKREL
ncbi:uncharacterized protein LOC132307501 [Cornus florida]|uniref:uncharacterized protein LOC132307501 n=1 Tax=Cornus florida TaxID=4283 RepID=UPI002898AD5B|nr:uncharacterized protein LOC132307501 [Cornus florida]